MVKRFAHEENGASNLLLFLSGWEVALGVEETFKVDGLSLACRGDQEPFAQAPIKYAQVAFKEAWIRSIDLECAIRGANAVRLIGRVDAERHAITRQAEA